MDDRQKRPCGFTKNPRPRFLLARFLCAKENEQPKHIISVAKFFSNRNTFVTISCNNIIKEKVNHEFLEVITMKKKFAALLAVAAMFTAVPAMAATPAALQGNCLDSQQCQKLSDKDNNDGWYCGRGHGHGPGCGRHDGSCWDNQQK